MGQLGLILLLLSKQNRVQQRSGNAKKKTAIKTKMVLIALFFFNLNLVLISNFVFTSRNLIENEITQLPERAFSGLRRLDYL